MATPQGQRNFVRLMGIEVRFANLNEPTEVFGSKGALKYQACIMISKDREQDIAAINEAIKNAAAAVNAKGFKSPLRDGDVEKDGGIFKDRLFINARTLIKPKLFSIDDAPIENIPYDSRTGFYACVTLNFIGYNNEEAKAKGVTTSISEVRCGNPIPRMDFAHKVSSFGKWNGGSN